ncbi:MAG TPA: methyltransferase domain-containing protein [Noviherbaspirillum sp.]|uniref:methyltransferase domain-containing protein n=1 Tax=Noviherbaspirillum sp. TaxID=1926288 RepID=UPI002B466E5B|nr:methyltransferase domain-containing protein [Noviherbaspirillum sp.]HJV86976.1 methyltransferase domain-containing protein [Noviherbaspirillum sp.]
MAGPTQEFWQSRFASGNMPWDRGGPGTQLARWVEDGSFKPGERVIVPGCGQGWDVVALAAAGMKVTGLDYAPDALALCRQLIERNAVQAELVEADVLTWMPVEPVDAVFDQACLCALHPDLWVRYANQLHQWLRPGGKLLALFMQLPPVDKPEGVISGPPYHCDINAMRALFPADRWEWPKPPYAGVAHQHGLVELPVVLVRK